MRSIAQIVPGLNSSIANRGGSNSDPPPAEDGAYESSLIEVLERINFKMQPEQASKWGASRPEVDQMNTVRTFIGRILHRLHDRSPAESEKLAQYRDRFRKDLVNQWSIISSGSSASPMTVGDIPAILRDQFYQNGRYVIKIYPKGSTWQQGTLTRFVKSLESVNPGVLGDPIELYVFSSAFKKASIEASVYALIAISLLLIFTFKSWRLMLISLVPLIVGSHLDSRINGGGRLRFQPCKQHIHAAGSRGRRRVWGNYPLQVAGGPGRLGKACLQHGQRGHSRSSYHHHRLWRIDDI